MNYYLINDQYSIIANCRKLWISTHELRVEFINRKKGHKVQIFHNYRHQLASVCGLKIIYNALLVEEISEHAEELESGRLMVTVEPQ